MIEMGKQYRTRDGRAVRILAVDMKSNEPVAAVIRYSDDVEGVYGFAADGRFNSERGEHPCDLIEVKPPVTRWLVTSDAYGYETQEKAQDVAREHGKWATGVSVVKVTWTPGEGL